MEPLGWFLRKVYLSWAGEGYQGYIFATIKVFVPQAWKSGSWNWAILPILEIQLGSICVGGGHQTATARWRQQQEILNSPNQVYTKECRYSIVRRKAKDALFLTATFYSQFDPLFGPAGYFLWDMRSSNSTPILSLHYTRNTWQVQSITIALTHCNWFRFRLPKRKIAQKWRTKSLCACESVNWVGADFERQLPPVEHLLPEGVSLLLEIGLGLLSCWQQGL